MKRSNIQLAVLSLVMVSVLSFSCRKEKDYRDRFTGTYFCDYMKITQTVAFPPDTIDHRDTIYSSNVTFTVVKAEHPNKLIILDSEVLVHNDGSLQYFGEPWWFITGEFFSGNSMRIKRGVGKVNYFVEYWNGEK